jgi:Peptidase family M41
MSKVQTAYHEAGHAVVAYFMGLTIEGVSIVEEDEESRGLCFTPLPEGFQPDEQREGTVEILESHLAACLAGAVAQEMYTGETVQLEGNDLDGATHLMVSLDYTCSDEVEQRAKDILRREWAAVEELAARLLEQGEINSEQAIAAMERVR